MLLIRRTSHLWVLTTAQGDCRSFIRLDHLKSALPLEISWRRFGSSRRSPNRSHLRLTCFRRAWLRDFGLISSDCRGKKSRIWFKWRTKNSSNDSHPWTFSRNSMAKLDWLKRDCKRSKITLKRFLTSMTARRPNFFSCHGHRNTSGSRQTSPCFHSISR